MCDFGTVIFGLVYWTFISKCHLELATRGQKTIPLTRFAHCDVGAKEIGPLSYGTIVSTQKPVLCAAC